MIQTKLNFCQYPNNDEGTIRNKKNRLTSTTLAQGEKNSLSKLFIYLGHVHPDVVAGDDGHMGHGHRRPHLVDHTAGIAARVL